MDKVIEIELLLWFGAKKFYFGMFFFDTPVYVLSDVPVDVLSDTPADVFSDVPVDVLFIALYKKTPGRMARRL